MFEFVSGLITMGFVVAGLFFLRFWRRAGDRLFAAFAVAFWMLAPIRRCSFSSGFRSRSVAGSIRHASAPSR